MRKCSGAEISVGMIRVDTVCRCGVLVMYAVYVWVWCLDMSHSQQLGFYVSLVVTIRLHFFIFLSVGCRNVVEGSVLVNYHGLKLGHKVNGLANQHLSSALQSRGSALDASDSR